MRGTQVVSRRKDRWGGPIQLPRVIEGGVWINNLQPPGPLSLLILPTSNGNGPHWTVNEQTFPVSTKVRHVLLIQETASTRIVG